MVYVFVMAISCYLWFPHKTSLFSKNIPWILQQQKAIKCMHPTTKTRQERILNYFQFQFFYWLNEINMWIFFCVYYWPLAKVFGTRILSLLNLRIYLRLSFLVAFIYVKYFDLVNCFIWIPVTWQRVLNI